MRCRFVRFTKTRYVILNSIKRMQIQLPLYILVFILFMLLITVLGSSHDEVANLVFACSCLCRFGTATALWASNPSAYARADA